MNRRSLLLYRRALKAIDDDLSLYKYRKASEVKWLFEGYRDEQNPREVAAVQQAVEVMVGEMREGRYPQSIHYLDDDVEKANYQRHTMTHRGSIIYWL